MREASIGRVLVASLHQGIADLLPTRLNFYENWLNTEGLRDGTIGLAPFYAVLSFLRQEGEAYDLITTRAGEYAAEWTVQSMPAYRRSLLKSAPGWLRRRLLLRAARRLVRDCYDGNRAVSRVSQGIARIDLRASIFCTVREPVDHHLCGFYAAAFVRFLDQFDVPARASILECRATGAATCILTLALAGGVESPAPEAEAA
jgi:hypothetical protein